MDVSDGLLVAIGGLVAGIINAMAGGGSLITVPLLTLAGLPGGVANGTNRVGVLVMNATATASFRRHGVSGVSRAVPVMVPVLIGSLIGAVGVSQLADDTFERLFGFLMVPLLFLSLRPPKADTEAKPWPPLIGAAVFFAIGLYGGAFQAGVGLILTVALARSGVDLVMANAIKVVVILALTAVAMPVFIARGLVDWPFALVLAIGYAVGGALGARIAVLGGERVIRPVLIGAVVVLASRMLGLW